MDEPPNTNTQGWITRRKDDPRYSAAITALIKAMSPDGPKTDLEFHEANRVIMPWYFSDPWKISNIPEAAMDGSELPTAWALQTMIYDAKEENRIEHVKEAGNVKARTLIIWGQEDPMCWSGDAELLKEGIAGAELVVIEKTGLMCWIEAPDVFFSAVDRFLDV